MMSERPWAIIGNPENRRIQCFQQALHGRGLAPATVLSYESLLRGDTAVQSLPGNAIVRVESPGENLAVEHLLIKVGETESLAEGTCIYRGAELADLPREYGRILAPRQWYRGFVSSIRSWSNASRESTGQIWTTTADALETQFDKALCQARCATNGVPTPQSLGIITGWHDLRKKMAARGFERVFVKLATSSSASGVVAIHLKGNRVSAITSVEVVKHDDMVVALYNSLKIRRYSDLESVRELVDTLAKHRTIAEEWLPKASLGDRVCDLRLLVIAGEPRHAVVRTSRTPLTNLHLGNRRGDINEFWRRVPVTQQQELWRTCRQCAELFPKSLHLGLDVLFTPGFRQHYLLEINAFGDLLPNVIHRGLNTYESQVDTVLRGWTPL